ncbi:MAG TPA: PH domain-containing protein [Phycisphaerae bacterium]|nr:PH domain-containing protein [Phycisphaerae bacterium]
MSIVLEDPPKKRPSLVANAQGDALGLAVEQAVPAHLLDGDEIVHFAIKPSPWFVVFMSLRWVATGFLLALLAASGALPIQSTYRWYLYQLGFGIAGLRLAWALLEWVSRLYILTNRRVMRIRGIVNVEVFECSLERIQHTELTLSFLERLTRIGTILFQTAGGAPGARGGAAWRMVSRPLEVHEKLREAIHRARNRGNHGL